jgi:hypothetical protein|nr:MAG TPA: tail assembly chaperone protein [Caudoviricetes sp.]
MQDTMKYIDVKGVEYPLVFNLNVMEKIQEKYGSYEKWGDLTDGKNSEINIGALKFGILEMINEGIDIENESKEVKREFLTDKQVGRIITEIGMETLAKKMKETVIDSTKNDEEAKNV